MKEFVLYRIIFKDGSCFIGGDYINTKWTEVPNKPIKCLFYTLPNGNEFCLKGYDKYYQMIEVAEDIYGKTKGRKKIEFAYIMGERKGLITSYKIALFKNSEHEIGDIKKQIYREEDNYIKKLNFEGWK